MKVYGLKIGACGVEFSVLADRQKALEMFTKGSSCKINTDDQGLVYKDNEAIFGTYERETKETIVRCNVCKMEHSSSGCSVRDYPSKYTWKQEYEFSKGFICDGCLAKATKEKEVFDAKNLLNNVNNS